MLTLATKNKSQEPQIIKFVGSQIETIALPRSTKHEQSLHESFHKLKSESAHAVNALVTYWWSAHDIYLFNDRWQRAQ